MAGIDVSYQDLELDANFSTIAAATIRPLRKAATTTTLTSAL